MGLPIGAPSPKLLSSPKLPPPVVTVRPLRPAAQNLSPRTKHLNEKLTRLKKSEGNESHCVKKPDETSSVPCRFFLQGRCIRIACKFLHSEPMNKEREPTPHDEKPMKAAMEVHSKDDMSAAVKHSTTHQVKSILRLEETEDMPALKKRRKEKDTEVKPPESASTLSFNSGEAEYMKEDTMEEIMEETIEPEMSEDSGTEERFFQLDEILAQYKRETCNLQRLDSFLEDDDDKDKNEAAVMKEPQVNDYIFSHFPMKGQILKASIKEHMA